MATDFNEKELEITGYNYPLRAGGVGGPIFGNRPITSGENLIKQFKGEQPMWMPLIGMRGWDLHVFRPRLFPDNVATHLVYDAEPQIEYDSNIKRGWFELDWEFVPVAGGATVHPGAPKVPSAANWEDYITLPDIDALDWEKSAQINKDYLNTTACKEIAFLSCLWERLISLMDVENAAIALIDEDEKEGVHRLFDKLCDMYDKMIEYSQKYYSAEVVLWHDDWGTQKSTFFSPEVHKEMILPYMKRIVDSCHKRGMYFELHSCGLVENLVPNMIEAGIDLWCGQGVNDFDMLAHKYKDSNIVFGIPCPTLPDDASEEECTKAAIDILDKYEGCNVAVATLFMPPNPNFGKALYKESRKRYRK